MHLHMYQLCQNLILWLADVFCFLISGEDQTKGDDAVRAEEGEVESVSWVISGNWLFIQVDVEVFCSVEHVCHDVLLLASLLVDPAKIR